MSDWIAALLGLVQGFSEFLPISSSGHLVMAEELLGVSSPGILFEIAVHVATLVSVLVFYRGRVLELLRGALAGSGRAWSYLGKLGVATLPAVAAALVALDFLEGLFDRPAMAGAGLLATGAFLMTTRRTLPRAHGAEPSWSQAFWIGCAQMVAIVPGVSRSGTTVAAALALGVAPLAAAEFSFLMSVAAIVGAALLQIPEASAASSEAIRSCLVGGAVACVGGLAALALFVRLLRSQAFHHFAWYTWLAGAAFLAWLALR